MTRSSPGKNSSEIAGRQGFRLVVDMSATCGTINRPTLRHRKVDDWCHLCEQPWTIQQSMPTWSEWWGTGPCRGQWCIWIKIGPMLMMTSFMIVWRGMKSWVDTWGLVYILVNTGIGDGLAGSILAGPLYQFNDIHHYCIYWIQTVTLCVDVNACTVNCKIFGVQNTWMACWHQKIKSTKFLNPRPIK